MKLPDGKKTYEKKHKSRRFSVFVHITLLAFCVLMMSAYTRIGAGIDGIPPWVFTYNDVIEDYNGAEEEDHGAVWPDDMVEYEELDMREEGLELEGRIPSLTGYAGFIQLRINNEIDRIIAEKISDARESRSRSIMFAYEIYFSDPYMSIVIKSTATSASSHTEVVSLNFNANTGVVLNAADIAGQHVVLLADRLLTETIRRNPERYNPGFTGMREDQAFSVTDDEITFWLNEFQLLPGFEGIMQLTLRLGDINEISLSREQYHIRDGFNFKMVPLRTAEGLGYEVVWNSAERSISVLYNGELVIELTPDVNSYVRESRFTRSLEAAPEIVGGLTYVPLSFFDQILSLVAFTIDEEDNIFFASYPVNDSWFER